LKVYRSTRRVLAEVERVLVANRPSVGHSPLQEVIDLLCSGRHYTWAGIFLAAGENSPQLPLGAGGDTPGQMEHPETRSKIVVSIKSPSRELGLLAVESDREDAFGVEDRVLFDAVADALARFLAGRGKYLARRARQATTVGPLAAQARAAQP
jgi:putative methionine-R-sulfoxide reductase with GAF domain